METLSEAMTRLVHDGYTEDVSAHDDGKLHCSGCHSACDATNIGIDHVVRFEGDSNPDDEAVLFALDCGAHKSLYAVAFGPETPPNDVTAVRALSRRHRHSAASSCRRCRSSSSLLASNSATSPAPMYSATTRPLTLRRR